MAQLVVNLTDINNYEVFQTMCENFMTKMPERTLRIQILADVNHYDDKLNVEFCLEAIYHVDAIKNANGKTCKMSLIGWKEIESRRHRAMVVLSKPDEV